MDSNQLRAFSFGGGVQSTACLVLAAERKINFPFFVFANTGDDSEAPETLEYIDQVSRPYAEQHGIELVMVQKTIRNKPAETLYENIMGDNKTIAIPVRLPSGAPARRKCTRDWKIYPVHKELRKRGATTKNPAIVGIGISTDEFHRAKDSRVPIVEHEYPLLNLRIDRSQCAEIIKKAGLKVPPKSSCWFCPYKKKREWAEMAAKDPETFEKACQIEERLQEKKGSIKGNFYLTDAGRPLSEAVLPDHQMKIWGDADDCSGYCWT